MSRVAKNPVVIPKGVEVKLAEGTVVAKGSKGELTLVIHPDVEVREEEGTVVFAPRNGEKKTDALAGTMRALVNNLVIGVSEGYQKRLLLQGVGYRAKSEGGKIDLTLGFSHPVSYNLPKGVTGETPTQTEIILKSADKQLLGQVAADIRGFRPPEPYKGKGVRYADERVRIKEAKKK